MTIRQRVVQKADGTTTVKRTGTQPARPRPAPCPECGHMMTVAQNPQPHYVCDTWDGGCGITRDINADTGRMTEYPFDPNYIGDVVIEDWD